MHRKGGTDFWKISAWLSTSARQRIEVVGFLTILSHRTIFQSMLNRIASLLLRTFRLFASRSALLNNANLKTSLCIETGRSLALMVIEAVLKVWFCRTFWWSMGYVSKVWGEYFGFRSTTQHKKFTKHQRPFFRQRAFEFEAREEKSRA